MRVGLKFPVMAKAIMKGSKGERRLLVAHEHVQEVPEISASETEVALPAVAQVETGDTMKTYHRNLPELRLYQGGLFRFVGLEVGDEHFATAFSDRWALEDFVAASEGMAWPGTARSPLSTVVASLYNDRLAALAMDSTDPRNKTWPNAVGYWTGDTKNEKTLLRDALAFAQKVDQDDLSESFEMHRAQGSRLLAIDGQLWFETKPPCIEVDTRWSKYKAKDSSVTLRYRYMPEKMWHQPTAILFPLHKAEEALETAERLQKRFRMREVVPVQHPFEASDHPAFDFDTNEDIVLRTGHALALNILKLASSRPDRVADVDPRWLDRISEMFHAHNHVIGRPTDYSGELERIVSHFFQLAPTKARGFDNQMMHQLRKTLPLVLEMADDLPIKLTAVQGHAPLPS